jgi:UDP-glucose 4-epimerase
VQPNNRHDCFIGPCERFDVKVLITGGAGFIGSTIASACLDNDIVPVILDDLSAGRDEFVRERLFYDGDFADRVLLDQIFAEHPDIDAVIHCAAKIVVPESVAEPLNYYRNNVAKVIDLVDAMERHGCQRLLFSSSAAIYLPDTDYTVDENSALNPESPYAATKMMAERILADAAAAAGPRVMSLRFFNPIGADPQLRTGLQNPKPSHALGKLIEAYQSGGSFTVTGVNWPTRDGSGLRDYIHVWDLARAHVLAVQKFDDIVGADNPYEVINLGTGDGTTVRELVTAFQAVVGDFPVTETGPRPGDVVGCCTRTAKAERLLGWRAQLSVEDGIRDALAWVEKRQQVLGV